MNKKETLKEKLSLIQEDSLAHNTNRVSGLSFHEKRYLGVVTC